MSIKIYDVFELNRILRKLLEQQASYKIQTAFKLYNLIKWLDETEEFIFKRMKMVFGEERTDEQNPLYMAFLSSQMPFTETSLTIDELLDTENDVNVGLKDVEILEKMLPKAEI